MEKTLDIQAVPWSDDVRAALAPAWNHDTTRGLVGPDDLAAMGGAPFEVSRNGVPLAHYVLSVRRWSGGNEGFILAAAGQDAGRGALGGGNLPATVLPVIEAQFLDVRAVTVHTKRLGLARKLGAAGYVIDGYILRKHIVRGHA